ncbi:DMT family transporter [Pasteurella skyensis]|uniref:DMT family transporter n=1 Tax=Phocoenobacter skyensis TaxID=97481 RepID=A0AAJ6NZW0_9PAST|nr:DMT family transporter [Pasteurella skyensis]MDP8161878.1 DMT family transporter [Pasteurella skyensis]MDP8172034.1 DMT family transporter [Pasteurella skyensis]MDP8176269.1 DMT family transporter [Pasteurella skyensis]MDP8178289.1 DMT family transporter [Pasteurella skyensis]MDP8182103.1 DMT family transporter [Pasteurella skyensis]
MLYLLAAAFLWGTSFIAGKYAEALASPEIIVLFRWFIALPFIAHIAIPSIRKLTKPLLYKVIGVSFLINSIFLLQFIGLEYTTASNAATMIGFEPLLVILAGHYFFNQPTNKKQILLSLIALVGIALVMGVPDLSNNNFIGCFIVFSSTVVIAITLQQSKVLIDKVPKGSFTALTLFFAALWCIPCTLLLVDDWQITPSISGIASVLYLGIGCTLLASWLWNIGLSKTAANLGGIFLALEPIFGVFFAIILLNERPDLYASIGIILVIFSVLYSLKESQNMDKSKE